MKWFAAVAATLGWVFSWSQLRGIRTEYIEGDLGPVPLGLLVMLGLTSTLMLALAVAALMNADFWPRLSVAVGVLFVAAIYLSHLALLSDTVRRFDRQGTADRRETSSIAGDSLEAMLKVTPAGKPRSQAAVAIFIAGVPTALILSGLSMLIRPSGRSQEVTVG